MVLMAPAAIYKDRAKEGCSLGIKFDPNYIPDYITAYHHRIGKMYLETTQELPIYATARKYVGPVYIVQGKSDQEVPYQESQEFASIYSNCQLNLLDNENHFFNNHMDLAVSCVIDFFRKHL